MDPVSAQWRGRHQSKHFQLDDLTAVYPTKKASDAKDEQDLVRMVPISWRERLWDIFINHCWCSKWCD